MACDPTALLEASKCFSCKYDSLPGLYQAVKIRLLCAIRDGETLECDPDVLAQEARCIFACVPRGAMDAIEIKLLCDILEASGGGGGNGGSEMVEALPDNETFFSEAEISGYRNTTNLTGVTSLTINTVTSLGAYDFEKCNSLATVAFPLLTTLGHASANTAGSYIQLSNCPLLTSFTAPLLATARSSFTNINVIAIFSNSIITSVSLPALVTTRGQFRIRLNPLMTSVSLPLWIPEPGSDSLFNGNALTAASVNHVLARHVASPTWGVANEVLSLNGGTNAAPTGQGITDKATLIGRGATVSTN